MASLSENNSYIPSLVFFETTTACDYACLHCRAEAQTNPSPDQLTEVESVELLNQIRALSDPAPELIFTGGNTLLRNDFKALIKHAGKIGLQFSVSPSATELLTDNMILFLRSNGMKSMSISLDGTEDGTHDWLRQKKGSYLQTIKLVRRLSELGIKVQINTTVMHRNIMELPRIATLLLNEKIDTWELFFLIKTGRGNNIEDVTSEEYMQINHWLSELSSSGLTVRTVEGPIHRVIAAMRKMDSTVLEGPTYRKLVNSNPDLFSRPGIVKPMMRGKGKNGHRFRGTLFISQNGEVSPSGLFNVPLGNIREKRLAEILEANVDLLDTRNSGKLEGKCGRCNFNRLCGGSRARALYETGNPFAEDPDCLYIPIPLVGGGS